MIHKESSEYVFKICDFGLSVSLKDLESYTFDDFPLRSTIPDFFSVDWKQYPVNKQQFFLKRTDVWDFGCLLVEIYLRGDKPYPKMINGDVIKYVNNLKLKLLKFDDFIKKICGKEDSISEVGNGEEFKVKDPSSGENLPVLLIQLKLEMEKNSMDSKLKTLPAVKNLPVLLIQLKLEMKKNSMDLELKTLPAVKNLPVLIMY